MQCNKCGSDHTQRLEVIFEGGTQTINTASKTAGAGLGGAFGIGGAVTKTSGTSQSALAQKATPPAKQNTLIGLCGLGGFFFIGGSFVGTLVGLATLAGGAYLGYRAYQYNANTWPGLYQRWHESWMCQKCGNIYRQT